MAYSDPISEKQLSFIENLEQDKRVSRIEGLAHVNKVHETSHATLTSLNRKEASTLIEYLKELNF